MNNESFQLTHSNVREANMGDLEALQTLDEACFDYAWGRPEFAEALKSRGATVILVVEHNGKLIASMAYIRLAKRSAAMILRVAVSAPYRRRQIASQLLDMVHRELDSKTRLVMCVQESDLIAQLLLKKNKFTCMQTLPNYFTFGGATENAYEFVYGGVPVKKVPPTLKSNGGPLTVDLANRFGGRGRQFKPDDCV